MYHQIIMRTKSYTIVIKKTIYLYFDMTGEKRTDVSPDGKQSSTQEHP